MDIERTFTAGKKESIMSGGFIAILVDVFDLDGTVYYIDVAYTFAFQRENPTAVLIDNKVMQEISSDRELTSGAQEDRDEFDSDYGHLSCCSCHISPPCGYCTHPGNPDNQEEDDECWELIND